MFNVLPPLSLYIHLPWCIQKCPYCDFNSHEINRSGFEENQYIEALIRDLDYALPRIQDREIISIFIGGGTPSLFSAKTLTQLLNALRLRFNIKPEIEITLEVNPGTAEASKFKSFHAAGINRLSIGVQSFNDNHLQQLGRVHNANEAYNAIVLARDAGFEAINLDLMFGLPHQTIEEAMIDLKVAIMEKPTHLSWYQLTIEPNTVFNAKPPTLPDEDDIWEMQVQGRLYMEKKGFFQYEVSSYAKKDYQCQHNLNYWQFGDYLGVGAGAHSKLTERKIERSVRHRIPARYMELAGTLSVITETREINHDELPLEFMMNALRLIHGVSTECLLARTGVPIDEIKEELSQAKERGWLNPGVNILRPTTLGTRYLNDLLGLFVK